MKKKRKKIIPSNWTKEITCPHCTAIITLIAKEIYIGKKTHPMKFFGGKKSHKVFMTKCSNCGTHIILNKKCFPTKIARYLVLRDKHILEHTDHFFEDFFHEHEEP